MAAGGAALGADNSSARNAPGVIIGPVSIANVDKVRVLDGGVPITNFLDVS